MSPPLSTHILGFQYTSMRQVTQFPAIENFFEQHAELIAATVLALLSASAIVFPRAIPFFYFALTTMAAVEIWRTGRLKHALKTPNYSWIVCGLLVCWCFITILWSQAPMQGLSKVLFLGSIIIAAWIISSWLDTITPSMSKHLKLGLFYGIACGAIYLAIDTYFGQLLKITFLNAFELQHTDNQKHYKIINNEIANLPLYLLNRNVATLNILIWPSILLAVGIWKGKALWLVLAIMFAMVGIATFLSEHETSKIAFLVSALLFGLTLFMPRFGVKAIALFWALSIVLVIPTTIAANDAKLYKADWLPYSARARIIIWSHTAHEYLKNPILGVGARTTQVASDANKTPGIKPDGYVLTPQTARHGHNIFLQSWYELGAVGAFLLLVTGLAILRQINMLTDQTKPYAIATFGVAMVLAAFTWGMWQVWYISMFVFGLTAVQIAAHQNSIPDIK